MVRRLACAAVAALLILAVAAAEAQPPSIEEVPTGIERLLSDYASAYLNGNADLLERTVHGELLTSELEALANASDVPFTSYEVRISTQFSGNLAFERIQSLYPGLEVATLHVIEGTRISDEASAFEDDGAYTFVRSSQRDDDYDGWRLASKRDLDVLGFFSPHHLWHEGPVAVLRSDRFLLLTHPDVTDEMRQVLEQAEAAMDQIGEFWPEPVEARYVIIAPPTTEGLGRIIQTTLELTNFVAFVAGGSDREDGWEPTGPRLFVHRNNFNRYGDETRIRILAHELIHAITRPLSGPHIPTWVEEGLADLGAGTPRRLQTGGSVPEDFPTRLRFSTGPVTDIQRAYDQSLVAFAVLSEELGPQSVVRFYEELGSARVVAGTEDYHVRRAIEAIGWSYDEWVEAWQSLL